MNLQTFKAPTMAEALSLVKSAMGIDAVILHTRTYHRRFWLGLRRREIVEITAGRGLNVGGQRRSQPQQQQAARQIPSAVPSSRQQLSGYIAGPSTAAPPTAIVAGQARNLQANRAAVLEQPAVNTAAVLGLTQEVNDLKAMVKQMVVEYRHEKVPQVPEELFSHYMQLIENQVAEELAAEIIKNIQKSIRPEHLGNAQFILDKLAEQLERLIPVAGPIQRTKTVGPHVVALIGPTGVGKTTTIAKLAANLKLREKRKVGLITIDTYRIAAIDQLKKYADIIGSPLKVVGNAEDLREAIRSMSDCEYILVDTAGRSPKDTLKLNELKGFLEAAQADEVHLVLSTTSSQDCVELAIERFADVRCDKIIFTKLDEAPHIGLVLNIVRKVNKSLSYVTTGQDVPDDIEVGRGHRLAQLILGSAL